MEALLKRLFDYQKFERDPALQRVIDETAARYESRALSDEEVNGLFAAGDNSCLHTLDPPEGKPPWRYGEPQS